MISALLCSALALQSPVATSRRAVLQKVAAAAPLVAALPALAAYDTPLVGTAIRPEVSTQLTPTEAANRPSNAGPQFVGVATSKPFVGTYEDPLHAGCKRTVALLGPRDYQIDGADEDGKPWKVLAKRSGPSTFVVDFTPKGGPAGVEAKQDPKTGGLKFPDGNVWKKL